MTVHFHLSLLQGNDLGAGSCRCKEPLIECLFFSPILLLPTISCTATTEMIYSSSTSVGQSNLLALKYKITYDSLYPAITSGEYYQMQGITSFSLGWLSLERLGLDQTLSDGQ
ncbi:hypothetical protein EGR_11294 [Echinococcus granulosus]|uniref:Uncharacterized protein n=1 Tax=Echinococcus granulosus TaxID=6210 RepID=W6TYI4_ECHGR|nr:hypothetical protein EGR_11294 [Echinococcus granulosus]EUB53855.1 hypothetical protein EGR_11294 [Echinococcus granulosus]